MTLITLFKQPISKITLSISVTLYLLALNIFTTDNLYDSLYYGVWPALLTLLLFALFALFPRYLLKIILAIFTTIASVAIFFKYKYNIVMTEDIVLSAWINDASLSIEMVSINLCLWILFTGILPIIYIMAAPIKKMAFTRQLISSVIVSVLSLTGIISIFYFEGFEFRGEDHIRDPKAANSLSYFSPVDAIYSASRARKSYKNFKKEYADVTRLSEKYQYALSSDMQDIFVLVIVGETTRGDRFSLNGYTRNTNPKLSTVKNLYSFSDVSSCDTITIRSMKCIFSRVTDDNYNKKITESAFTDIFRSLGFSTDIYALQGMTDIYNYLGYDKLVSKYAVLRTSSVGARDEALLPLLENAISNQNSNKLVILHTLGSHQSYHDRLSKDDEVFKPICRNADVEACPLDELNNAYDNTIVAIDAFIYKTIKMLENKKAVVLYVSDHGESLGENGMYYHGIPRFRAPREQFHVPMIVWLSDALINTPLGNSMSKKIASLNKADHFSHSNFFHSVLGCSGISSNNGGIDNSLNLCAIQTAPPVTATSTTATE